MPTESTNTAPSFNLRTGIARVDMGTAQAMALQSDGKVVLEGISGSYGSYDFSLAMQSYETELNNSSATADTVISGNAVKGQLGTSSDVDYYQITATGAGTLSVALDIPTVQYSFYNYFSLGLYDAAGNSLGEYKTGTDNTYGFGIAAAGTYYLKMSSSQEYNSNQYELTPTLTNGPPNGFESEPNNSLATADTITSGNAIKGQLSTSSDLDYYRITATGAGTLSVALDIPTVQYSFYNYFSLGLYDAAGNSLGEYKTGTDNTYGFGIAAAGTYYLKMSSSQEYNSNQYELTATLSNSTPTGSVTISGTAKQGQVLTAANTLADADGLGTISYQWLANGSTISGATGSTLTLAQAQVGKTISVQASYTDGGGTAESATSTATAAVANINDTPTGGVTITGTAIQGQTLTAANTLADADGLGIVSYQWLANGSTITGATGSTLTLAQAQVGKTISVQASYTDGFGFAESKTSSATTAVANVNDAPTASNRTLTATEDTARPLSVADFGFSDVDTGDALQSVTITRLSNAGSLKLNGTAVKLNPVITAADIGTGKLIFTPVANANGTAYANWGFKVSDGTALSASAYTMTVNITAVNDAPTGGVTISGTAKQGQVLRAANTLADVDGLGPISYQWLANGTAISGATNSTLTLAQAQVGKAISVQARYTDGGGTAESKTSSATTVVTNVNDAPTGGVSITGTAQQGQVLTISNTLADADGLGTISYQWLANGTAITGAIGSTLTLAQAQVGKAITVRASYTDGFRTAENKISSATAAVLNVNDAPTASNVTLTATEDTAYTLAVANFGFRDVDTGDALQSVTITRLSSAGSLKLNGTAVKLNQVISAADIGTGKLVFTPVANANGTAYANWGFKVSDGLALSASAYTMTVNVTAVRDDLTKTGTAGNDTLAGDTIDAGSHDSLSGLAGNDSLSGLAGNDTLDGGAGNDTLNGGSGNDTLIGGVGKDALTCGAGNDIFDFNALTELGLDSATRDVITDFTVGQDKIDLSTIDANTLLAGDQAFTFVTSFTTTAGQVRYSGGFVYLNTDTDTAAEYAIQLTGTVPAALTAANFVL